MSFRRIIQKDGSERHLNLRNCFLIDQNILNNEELLRDFYKKNFKENTNSDNEELFVKLLLGINLNGMEYPAVRFIPLGHRIGDTRLGHISIEGNDNTKICFVKETNNSGHFILCDKDFDFYAGFTFGEGCRSFVTKVPDGDVLADVYLKFDNRFPMMEKHFDSVAFTNFILEEGFEEFIKHPEESLLKAFEAATKKQTVKQADEVKHIGTKLDTKMSDLQRYASVSKSDDIDRVISSLLEMEKTGVSLSQEQKSLIYVYQRYKEFKNSREKREQGQIEVKEAITKINSEREAWLNNPENPSNIRAEQNRAERVQFETLLNLREVAPNLLSQEQRKLINHFEMMEKAQSKSHQVDTGMDPEIREWYQAYYTEEENKGRSR